MRTDLTRGPDEKGSDESLIIRTQYVRVRKRGGPLVGQVDDTLFWFVLGPTGGLYDFVEALGPREALSLEY